MHRVRVDVLPDVEVALPAGRHAETGFSVQVNDRSQLPPAPVRLDTEVRAEVEAIYRAYTEAPHAHSVYTIHWDRGCRLGKEHRGCCPGTPGCGAGRPVRAQLQHGPHAR